ncbi:MAG: alpha/beta hydrolase-fold protein [Bacteroidales bacterium]|nr:alpha/beta hydrolase-fold protein [Bacteroidales bacterium]
MAFLHCKFKSAALGAQTTVRLYLPCDQPGWAGREVRAVFTLLHGYTNDGDDWVHSSSALRMAADNGLALIIPDASNSFYCDMAAGPAWNTWLTQELPGQLDQILKLPRQREKNFLCGLSMGGYGALYIGMNHPERYAGIASFSGCLDLALMLQNREDPAVRRAFEPILGRELELSADRDLFRLAERVSRLPQEEQPKILCTAGRQDHEPYYIIEQNRRFHSHAKDLPLADYTYLEWDGAHQWEFWDRSLSLAIDRFVNPGYGQACRQAWSCKTSEEENK